MEEPSSRDAEDDLSYVVAGVRFFAPGDCQFVFQHVVSGCVVVGESSGATATADRPPSAEAVVARGDRVVTVEVFQAASGAVVGLQLTTQLGAVMRSGRLRRERSVGLAVAPGQELRGFSIQLGDGDASVVARTCGAPLAGSLEQKKLRVVRSARPASPGVSDFQREFDDAVEWVLPVARRGVVSVASVAAALIQIGEAFESLLSSETLEETTGVEALKAQVRRLHVHRLAISTLEQMPDIYRAMGMLHVKFAVLLDALASRSHYYDAMMLRIWEQYLEHLTTCELVEFLVASGDVRRLDVVAWALAATMQTSIPDAMKQVAQHVQLVRIATISGQGAMLRWLVDVAELDPLDHPCGTLQDAHNVDLCWRWRSPPVKRVSSVEIAGLVALQQKPLESIIRRRRFVNAARRLLAQPPQSRMSFQEIQRLLSDVTCLSDLDALDALAAAHLTTVERGQLARATALHLICETIAPDSSAIALFKDNLQLAKAAGRISADAYDYLTCRVDKMVAAVSQQELPEATKTDTGDEWMILVPHVPGDHHHHLRHVASLLAATLSLCYAPPSQTREATPDAWNPAWLLLALVAVDTSCSTTNDSVKEFIECVDLLFDEEMAETVLYSIGIKRADIVDAVRRLQKDRLALTSRITSTEIQFDEKRTPIASGSYGDVFKGSFRGQTVAFKQLLPQHKLKHAKIASFFAEATLMARLRHENIVQFVGVTWLQPRGICLVTEFMGGGHLQALLERFAEEKRPKGLDVQKTRFALHVAAALVYLHSLDPPVLHRDLKSSNILLDAAQTTAKLTDFGVSRERANGTMTSDVGSWMWSAPEILRGERYGVKADIFSFGVVLSELATNELPYASNTTAADVCGVQLRSKIIQGQESVSFSGLPSHIRELSQSCVALDPASRPTAAQAVSRLQSIIKLKEAAAAVRENALVTESELQQLAQQPVTTDSYPIALKLYQEYPAVLLDSGVTGNLLGFLAACNAENLARCRRIAQRRLDLKTLLREYRRGLLINDGNIMAHRGDDTRAVAVEDLIRRVKEFVNLQRRDYVEFMETNVDLPAKTNRLAAEHDELTDAVDRQFVELRSLFNDQRLMLRSEEKLCNSLLKRLEMTLRERRRAPLMSTHVVV